MLMQHVLLMLGVTVAAAGGTPPYLYAFVPSNTTPVSTDYTDATTDLDEQSEMECM
jgi:hypothetical protein